MGKQLTVIQPTTKPSSGSGCAQCPNNPNMVVRSRVLTEQFGPLQALIMLAAQTDATPVNIRAPAIVIEGGAARLNPKLF